VALRQVAEEVEAKRVPAGQDPAHPRARDERLVDAGATQTIGERLLALVTRIPARSVSSGAPGGRPSASARSSMCCG